MKQGSISIYLVMILTILMSIFLLCIKIVQEETMELKVTYASNATLMSCFAEYNRELYERYDVFFLDATYGNCFSDSSGVLEQMYYYADKNCSPASNIPSMFRRTFLECDIESIQINEVLLATDFDGKVFREEVLRYMKSKYGISMIEFLQEQYEEYMHFDIPMFDILQEVEKNKESIFHKAVVEDGVTSDGEIHWKEIEVENPTDKIDFHPEGILSIFKDEEKPLSNSCTTLDSLTSYRENCKGTMKLTEESDSLDILEETLFMEYIMEKTSNYVSPIEDQVLSYQSEYVIAGRNNDMDNLRVVSNQILAIREAINVAYLLTDQEKMSEIEVMAAGISAVATVPELEPLIKYGIVLAWGYAESISDIRRLLKGEKVAFIKTRELWHISLEKAIQASADAQGEDPHGMTYQEYLRLLLVLTPMKAKTYRMMDVIEMEMRNSGWEGFRFDACVYAIDAEFLFVDQKKTTYQKLLVHSYK